jgi:vanillate O-demethylase ferredoxin subunit
MDAAAGRIETIVARREMLSEDVVLLELVAAPGGSLPPFTPGAHIDVDLPACTRQYSLCGSPMDGGVYSIAVLRDPASRGGSDTIHDLAEGDHVLIGLPRNQFALEPRGESVLIGGGIGLTPILAMGYALALEGRAFQLHYAVNEARAAPFSDQLAQPPFAGRSTIHRTNRAAGRSFDTAANLPPYAMGTHIYVCGPIGLMDAVREAAIAQGWPEAAVHSELFGADLDVGGEGFLVRTARSGLDVWIGERDTIAEMLLDAGVDVPLSCEQGVCGTCLTRVIDGTPDHRDLIQSEAEKAKGDMIALCCSRSRSPVLVLDI